VPAPPLQPVTILPAPSPALPTLALSVPGQRLAAALKHGLAVRLSCSGAPRAALRLTLGARVVGRRSVACADARVMLGLRRGAVKRRVALRLTATAGARTATRRVTLR
jgi:hypothetical protein